MEAEELERARLRSQMAIELNKEAVEYSQKALRGALLLNGGAITAITVMQLKWLVVAMSIYGLGAAIAVLGNYFSYLATVQCAASYGEFVGMEPYDDAKFQKYRKYGAWSGLVSGAVFAIATVVALVMM